MRVKHLSISNILSIEQAAVDIEATSLILVEGWNHDADRANGSGKSAIFSAMVWGIYGDYPRGISISDFVKRGSKKASVTVTLETSGKTITVTRSRPGGFSATDDAGHTYSEAEYQSLLDITYQQYLLVGYFAQSLSQRFLDLNDTGRKDLIVKLMKADAFQTAKEKVDTDIKVATAEVTRFNNEASNLSSKVEAWTESLVDEEELATKKEALFSKVGKLDSKIRRLAEVEKPDVARHQEVIGKLQEQLDNISAAKGEAKSIRRQIAALDAQEPPVDRHDHTCPCCKEHLDVIKGKLVKHDSSSFARKEMDFYTHLEESKKTLLEDLNNVEASLSKEEQVRNTIQALQTKVEELTQEYIEAREQRRELEALAKATRQEMSTIDATWSRNQSLKAKIDEAKASISTISSSIEEVTSRISTLKTISDLFSPTGVQAYILDSVVELFNQKVQQHISTLWNQSTYELLTHRESKSGSVSAKMSDHLSVDGVDVAIGSLSGGERRCLSLAIDMALLEVVETYSGAKMNPIILDEPFDGMDNITRSSAVELLADVAKERVVVVIDHSTEAQTMFDRVVKVEKRGGTSTVAW